MWAKLALADIGRRASLPLTHDPHSKELAPLPISAGHGFAVKPTWGPKPDDPQRLAFVGTGGAIIPQIESSRMIPISTMQIQGDNRIPEHQATSLCSY